MIFQFEKNKKTGFAPIVILGIVAVLTLLGGGGYVLYKQGNSKSAQKIEQQQTAEQTKQSAKEQTAPQSQVNQEKIPAIVASEEKKPETATQDETADWKTYRNEKLEFEFKYPKEWELETDHISINEVCYLSNTNEKGSVIMIKLTPPRPNNGGGFTIEGVSSEACASAGVGWLFYGGSDTSVIESDNNVMKLKFNNNIFYAQKDFGFCQPNAWSVHTFHASLFSKRLKIVPAISFSYLPSIINGVIVGHSQDALCDYSKEYELEKKLFIKILSTFKFLTEEEKLYTDAFLKESPLLIEGDMMLIGILNNGTEKIIIESVNNFLQWEMIKSHTLSSLPVKISYATSSQEIFLIRCSIGSECSNDISAINLKTQTSRKLNNGYYGGYNLESIVSPDGTKILSRGDKIYLLDLINDANKILADRDSENLLKHEGFFFYEPNNNFYWIDNHTIQFPIVYYAEQEKSYKTIRTKIIKID